MNQVKCCVGRIAAIVAAMGGALLSAPSVQAYVNGRGSQHAGSDQREAS